MQSLLTLLVFIAAGCGIGYLTNGEDVKAIIIGGIIGLFVYIVFSFVMIGFVMKKIHKHMTTFTKDSFFKR